MYILACNELTDVSTALRSRCLLLEILPVNPEEMRRLLSSALAMTPFRLDETMLESIVRRSNGIPREAIKLLLEDGGAQPISGRTVLGLPDAGGGRDSS